jgi:hypothetical protein
MVEQSGGGHYAFWDGQGQAQVAHDKFLKKPETYATGKPGRFAW